MGRKRNRWPSHLLHQVLGSELPRSGGNETEEEEGDRVIRLRPRRNTKNTKNTTKKNGRSGKRLLGRFLRRQIGEIEKVGVSDPLHKFGGVCLDALPYHQSDRVCFVVVVAAAFCVFFFFLGSV